MASDFKRALKSAFFDTALLVAGGLGGGALTYWIFGDHWLINGLGAVIGAAIVYYGGRFMAGRAAT